MALDLNAETASHLKLRRERKREREREREREIIPGKGSS